MLLVFGGLAEDTGQGTTDSRRQRQPIGARARGTKVTALRWPDVTQNLSDPETSAVIEMALSDHISFAQIEAQYGLPEKEVKALMRQRLKPGSYRAWRRRVRTFADRRERYK